MTTPKKLRLGEVPDLSAWTSEALPAGHDSHVPDLSSVLPDYVDQESFEAWFGPQLASFRTWQLLVSRLPSLAQAIAWLEEAMKDLKRNDKNRLQTSALMAMPGKSEPACWNEARKEGLDWYEEVRRGEVTTLTRLVSAAIEALERERHAHQQRGRRSMRNRDQLLARVIERLRESKRPVLLSSGKEIQRHLFLKEAAVLADSVLAACGVPSGTKEDVLSSITRAARRG